jgi:hypothetical protein
VFVAAPLLRSGAPVSYPRFRIAKFGLVDLFTAARRRDGFGQSADAPISGRMLVLLANLLPERLGRNFDPILV